MLCGQLSRFGSFYLCCLPNVQEERMPQNQYGNPDPATPYNQLPQGLPLIFNVCLTA